MSLAAREPVVVRTAVVAAVTATLHALVVLGVLPIDQAQEDAIAAAVDMAGVAVAAVWSRAGVSPVGKYEAKHAEE